MKTLFALFVTLASFTAQADEVVAPPPGAQQGIESAFQREYAYLAAQREALARQRQKIDGKTTADLGTAKRSIQELATKLSRLQAGNDSLFAEVQDAEKISREERNRLDQLLVTWKKASRTIEETRHSLRFESGKSEVDMMPPERLELSDIAMLGTEAASLAEGAGKLSRFRGSYLDEQGRLVESTLFRLGRVAVFAEGPTGVKLLGPNGKGSLKVVEEDKNGQAREFLEKKIVSSVPVFLFESLQDRITIKKPSGLTDKLADMVPLLFLGLLFLMVGFLFAQLARA